MKKPKQPYKAPHRYTTKELNEAAVQDLQQELDSVQDQLKAERFYPENNVDEAYLKEYINKLSQAIFMYNQPELLESSQGLHFAVMRGLI